MRSSVLKTIVVGLVAAALTATVLVAGCGSGAPTTTQTPATTSTSSSATSSTASPSTTAGVTTTTAGATSTTAGVTTTAAASADGKALYTQYCVSCHQGGLGSITAADQAQVERVIKTGKDSMPGYADKLSAEQITAIFTYLTTLN